jgi:hypothetical protein
VTVENPLPGWYEVHGGRSLHRVIDGGRLKMRTTCGLGILGIFYVPRILLARHRMCQHCQKIERKLSPGREGKPE